ncbi:MAG TPA: MBL fold metallo-hydrolase [Vicinamibacterales bacterium]|nr:MBL fold metallo-hydrolase [Vicinamibacterales bacterium]
MSTFPKSDHCDGERFFNRYESADRSFGEVLKWMRTRQRTRWPKQVALAKHPTPPVRVEPGQAGITFIGHSTFLIRTASRVLITDPVFTSHAGPFGRLGPRRVRPPAIAPDALPPIDVVFVSHNHYDHFQPSSLRLFAARASFAAPLGLARSLPSEGGSLGSIVELDWWQSATVNGAQITSVPAQHFSARTPWDRDRTLWCGFVVQVDGITVYFAGDTGYSPHFAEIAVRFPSIDVALLPIGAYEPRWFMTPAHMNPEEAVRAHLDLRPRLSIGMHFGTFQLTDEGIDDPLRALEQARGAAGVDANAFRVLDFGESFVTGDQKGRGIQETS